MAFPLDLGLILVIVLSFVAHQVLSWRRATGERRQQLKWLATSAAVTLVMIAMSLGTSSTSVLGEILGIGLAALPVGIGVGILKYRLYDIDVVISKTIVYGSLAAFITLVYVLIVVGIGSLGSGFVRAGSRPNLGLSILATAVVAVAFQPVRERAQRLANRLVFGKRATPYEALSEFAGRMAGTYAAEDALPRMARVLAEGTGAARAVVWLKDGAELAAGACWPSGAAGHPPRVGFAGRRGARHRRGRPGRARLPPGRSARRAVGGQTAGGNAHAGRGQAHVRPRGAGRPGAAQHRPDRAAPRQAGRAAGLAAADRRRARRPAAADRARHPRRRPAAAAGHRRHAGHGRSRWPARTRTGNGRWSPSSRPRPAARWRRCASSPAASTRPCSPTRAWPPPSAPRPARRPQPVEVSTDGVGRYPAGDRDRHLLLLRGSAAERRPARARDRRYGSAWPRTAPMSRSRSTDDGPGFDPAAAAHGSGLRNMSDRLAALGGSCQVDSCPGPGHHRRRPDRHRQAGSREFQ